MNERTQTYLLLGFMVVGIGAAIFYQKKGKAKSSGSPDEDLQGLEPSKRAEKVSKMVVGEDIDDATSMIESADLVSRVVSEDGEKKQVTSDLRNDRVNLTVVDGKVTDANVG